MNNWLVKYLGVFLFAVSTSTSLAMVVRHDIKSDLYYASESAYPAIFPLMNDGELKECVATLIAPQWAVTAAHCTALVNRPKLKESPHTVNIAGKEHFVTGIHIPEQYGSIKAQFDKQGNPISIEENIKDQTYDIALLKLKRRVEHIKPIKLHTENNEVGTKILLLGWGDYGTGDKGISHEQSLNDGKFRLAWNRITSVRGNFLSFDFDAPDNPESLPLEGVNGPGDSGGPALVTSGAELVIIGVSSGGGYPDSLTTEKATDNLYGWREYYVRMSQMHDWLIETMKSHS